MYKQMLIMLLPMRQRRGSAEGQWRGSTNHDANHYFRTIKIAKIGLLRSLNRARQETKLFVMGACVMGGDESSESISLALLLGG